MADGDAATFAIVLAKTALVLVDLSQKGVTKKRVETIDPARKHAELTFNDASAELLGADGEGWRLLERLYDAAAVYFAFAQVGGAEAAMWMARDYALQRQAFGRAIGSYQAIKHKLADCYVKLELARSNAYYGAMMLTDGGADLPLAAAAARIAATEAYDFASKENIQTHGGIGFTWEADTPVPLPPRAADGAATRRADGLEGQAGDPARTEERGVGGPTMDFNDTPEEAAFRKEVRAWLDANATRKSDDAKSFRARNDDPNLLKKAKEWQAKKADAGYARITWPKEYGGRGGSPILQVIYQQEEANYLVPLGFFDIGLGMCIPTMMAYAAPEHLKRYVKPALHGEEVWCQLFSEPAAGSDVAGIRTRAERDGDELGDQRPEGLDLGRALLRLRHRHHPHRPERAQAQGPHHVLPVDEDARRRGAADQADLGRRQLQRGVLHRRAHSRQPAPGQGRRGLEGGAHHADERAAGGRPAVGRPRRRRADGAGARHRSRRTGRRSRTSRCAARSPTGTSSSRA